MSPSFPRYISRVQSPDSRYESAIAPVAGDESLTQLAVEASLKALEMAKVDSKDVDLLILCTSTPDDVFGGACQVRGAHTCVQNLPFHSELWCQNNRTTEQHQNTSDFQFSNFGGQQANSRRLKNEAFCVKMSRNWTSIFSMIERGCVSSD